MITVKQLRISVKLMADKQQQINQSVFRLTDCAAPLKQAINQPIMPKHNLLDGRADRLSSLQMAPHYGLHD